MRIVLALLLSSLPALAAKTAPCDVCFQSTRWGMSPKEIAALYRDTKVEKYRRVMLMAAPMESFGRLRLADGTERAAFVFLDEKLVAVWLTYYMPPLDAALDRAAAMHLEAKNALAEKYGAPKSTPMPRDARETELTAIARAAGYTLKEAAISEWSRPDGVIRVWTFRGGKSGDPVYHPQVWITFEQKPDAFKTTMSLMTK